MHLPAAKSDSLLTAIELVGGQCCAPLSGGDEPSDMPRASAPADSFDDLLSSLEMDPSADASPPGTAKHATAPSAEPGDTTDDLLKQSVDGAAAVMTLAPGMIPPAPPAPVIPSAEFGRPVNSMEASGDAAARTSTGNITLPSQATDGSATGVTMQTGHSMPSRSAVAPSLESPADEVSPAHSAPTGRAIAPARDGESLGRSGSADPSASRVWTLFPAAKHVRRSAAERAAGAEPDQPGTLPTRDPAAATLRSDGGTAANVPQAAVIGVRSSAAFGEDGQPVGAHSVRSDAAQHDVTANRVSEQAAGEANIEFELPADEAVIRAEDAVASATEGQVVPAGLTALSQRISPPVDAAASSRTGIVAEIASDGATARVRSRDDRPSMTGEIVTDLQDAELLVQQAHSPAANAGDGNFSVAERNAGQQNDLGAWGDVDPASSGAASPLTGDAQQVLEPATTASTVVEQIGQAVEAWRDALQEQGTARFSAWLTPPDLGNVWVELTRSGDGLTARLVASDDSVQSLLETQAPELRQALSDSGITITELDLSGRPSGDSPSSRQQQQPPDRQSEPEPAAGFRGAPPPRGRTPRRATAIDVRA